MVPVPEDRREFGRSRHGVLRRATALVLAYVFSLTSVWAAAPPPVPMVAFADVGVPRIHSFAPFEVEPDTSVSHLAQALPAATIPPAAASLTEPASSGDMALLAAPTTALVASAAPSGVVSGQVLDDVKGLPLSGAKVKLVLTSGSSVETTTDASGRYSLPTADPQALILITKDGMTSVERDVPVQSGVANLPVDARLTPLAAPASIPAEGGTLGSERVRVAVAPGPAGSYALTPLSAQGLPALLPLGFSPLLAFDLRTDVSMVPALTATLTGLASDTLHLVEYRPWIHGWSMVTPGLAAGADGLTVSLPEPGCYALVVADAGDPVVAIPASGHLLTGVPYAAIPETATSTSAVTPRALPATGGTAHGTLSVFSTPLPSGTVVQARVKETFRLASGEVGSGEERAQDILLFRKPAGEGVALAATIPITPSRTFSGTELVQGNVHLDILAGPESVRGKTGGSDAVTLESGDARLSVAAGALGENTAIAFEQSGTLSSFLPSSGDLLPLAELVVDFSGKTLSRGAELSVLATGVSAEETLLVAEVVRVGDVPRVAVVALAQLVGDRVVSQAYPGLPGIVEGGRYVFYRSSPVGFVSGVTSSPAGPVKSLVTTDSLAFVSYSRLDGSYIVAARPGSVRLQARVTGTSLVGAGTATVLAAQTASLNLSLAGAVTGATVSPEDGSVAVPTSVQVEITTSSPMNPSTVSAESLKLFKGTVSDHQAVAVRFVLSASAKTLAVIPQAALESGISYTLVASGLADAFGGLVQVPTTTFKTKESTFPVYDVGKLTFSFPDQDGLVTVSAPAGTFPPGTTILIINSGNGVVLSLTAENDGAVGKLVPANLPATIDDQMLVTITDPLGHVTTFTRSQFFDTATGKTAVGPGGGVVEAADRGGVELRIPEGAVGKAATLRIESVSAAQLEALFPAQKPDLPGASVAGALKIESADKPEFKKEVKLAFPVPSGLPANPQDAFFYVYRRLEGPNGPDGKPTAAFEVLDQAFIEGTGDTARVVTASPPFAGYENSFGAFAVSPVGNFLIQSAVNAYAFLVWTYDATLPGKALPGVITGKVLRAKWVENTATTASAPVYEPVKEATVSVLDQGGLPAIVGGTPNPTLAITGADGTFTLWDTAYTGGPVRIAATLPGGVPSQGCPVTETDSDTVRCATAYEASPLDWKSTGLRFYRNIATATLTFPAAPPSSPPPAIQIKPMEKVDGSWREAGSLIVAETPLLIGFATTPALRVTGASIQGASYSVRPAAEADPAGLSYVLVNPDSADGTYAPPTPGSYTIVATALPKVGAVVTQSATFRVIAAGGGVDTLQGVPPEVIVPTVPKDGAKEVPVTVFPQVNFSAPVTRVAGAIHLLEGQTEVAAVSLSGFGPDGVVPKVASDSRVTSVTLQPLLGLKYDTVYTVRVDNTIQDLDTDAQGQSTPRKLVSRDSQGNRVDQPYQASFTTFGPEGLPGSTDTFGSPGIVVLSERAYLVQNNFTSGTLHAFDITDPTSPKDVTQTPATALGRPVDIAGDFHDGGLGEDVARGAPLIAVATASTNQPKPSNLALYDASGDSFAWLGSASLASSAVAGYINRVVVKGSLAYAVTVSKGVQVVDLRALKQNFLNTGGTSSWAYWKMVRSLNTDGEGFGQSAVTTIPVKNAAGGDYRLNDLKVGEWVVGGVSQRLVVAAGQPSLITPQGSLVVVNPQTSVVMSRFPIASADGTAKLTYANAVALGTLGTSPGAVVVGSGTSPAAAGPMLAAVNLANPAKPALLSLLSLQEASCLGQGIDVLLKDTTALVGGAQCGVLVNLSEPARPVLAGIIDGVGGRLALGESTMVYSTARSILGGSDPLGGVRAAAYGSMAFITKVAPDPILLDEGGLVLEDPRVDLRTVPRLTTNFSDVNIDKDSARFGSVHIELKDGAGSDEWLARDPLDPKATFTATPDVRDVANNPLPGVTRKLAVTRLPLMGESRDRQVEVRFAVPASTDKRYALRIYLAPAENNFSQTPHLTLPWTSIQAAYESDKVVFQDITSGSAKAQEPFVIRKIKRVTVPGMPELKEQQAFALETVLNGYHRYRVSLVEEGSDARECSRVEGQASFDAVWAQMLDAVSQAAQRTALGPYRDGLTRTASLGILPQVTTVAEVGFNGWSGYVARVTLPIKRVLGIARDEVGRYIRGTFEYQFVRGVIVGFVEGAEGDWRLVKDVGGVVLSPRVSLERLFTMMYIVGDEFLEIQDNPEKVVWWFDSLFRNLRGFKVTYPSPFEALDLVMRTRGRMAYIQGYLVGLVLWIGLEFFAIGAVTGGLGDIGPAVAKLAEGVGWAEKVVAAVSRAFVLCGYVAKALAEFGEASLMLLGQIWKAAFILGADVMPVLELRWARFGDLFKFLDSGLRLMAAAPEAGARALTQFSKVAATESSEAGKRTLRYIVKKAGENSPLVDRWLTVYRNRVAESAGAEANRAIAEAAEAAAEFGEGLPDDLNEMLVMVADRINKGDGLGANNILKAFVERYHNTLTGDRLQIVLRRLRDSVERYSDYTIAKTIEAHADPRVHAMPDESVEGTAKLIGLKECPVP